VLIRLPLSKMTTWPENLTSNGLYNNMPDQAQDPALMFGGANLDLSQLQHNPQFQTRQMIPSKRPREDSLSRSQTPAQQSQYSFQGSQQGGVQPLQVPSPFQHLHQGGSANATPSPTLQNQQFRPGMPPQRMQTVSPAQNSNGPQMSPMNYMQGSPMPPGYNQNFGGGSFPVQPVALSQNLQSRQQEAQRQYQMRLQQQQQQLAASNMAAQQRHQAGPMLGSSGQQPGMPMNRNPAQMQNAQGRGSAEAFVKNVSALMQQGGHPFNPQPMVSMRPVSYMKLYTAVMQQKGSKRVTAMGAWPMVAQMLGFPQQSFPTAGDEMRMIFEQNLSLYENAYYKKMQQQSQAMGIGNSQQAQMAAAMSTPQQMSPTKAMPQMGPNNVQAQQQQYLQQLQRAQAMQMDHATPVKNNVPMAAANGWSTPQVDSKMTPNALTQHRKSMSRQLEATPPQSQPLGFPSPSPGPDVKTRESVPPLGPPTSNGVGQAIDTKVEHGTEYQPKVRSLSDTHGGIDIHGIAELGKGLTALKPNIPVPEEMGRIDIRALGMSLQSGIHGEVRLALDYLVRISHDLSVKLELDKCEDLIDAIIDCAEEQLDLLAEDAPEVSDILDLVPYEDVIRNCRVEVDAIQEISEFGTAAYELDRTAERLIAVTTILRNLSFFEVNHPLLSSSIVLKFLSNAIRLVGTRILLLRSHLNTADFMKDLITLLSNISDKVELPSREEAHNVLHFLIAFAPCPRPGSPVRFTPYNPAIHRYLPPAVDTLAKLLARDDPNRTYYKQLFNADATSTPPYELLTRAFALAIAVVPDRSRRGGRVNEEMRIAEARKPYLMQGMLAADILASLAPGPDSGIACSWLEAEDGWAQSLLRLSVFLFSTDANPRAPPQPGSRQVPRMDHDLQGFQLITHRALAMLKKLGEKCKGGDFVVPNSIAIKTENADIFDDEETEIDGGSVKEVGTGNGWTVKADVLPKKEMLLGALLTPNVDSVALRQLCNFAKLDD
jgi:SWI/SNF chromatin-remodeling complex subunit SWI1